MVQGPVNKFLHCDQILALRTRSSSHSPCVSCTLTPPSTDPSLSPRYQHYLESVVEALQQVGQEMDMPDLLRRHATLTTNLDTLAAAQQQADARTEARWCETQLVVL